MDLFASDPGGKDTSPDLFADRPGGNTPAGTGKDASPALDGKDGSSGASEESIRVDSQAAILDHSIHQLAEGWGFATRPDARHRGSRVDHDLEPLVVLSDDDAENVHRHVIADDLLDVGKCAFQAQTLQNSGHPRPTRTYVAENRRAAHGSNIRTASWHVETESWRA